MEIELWQLTIMRKVLDDFCSSNQIAISGPEGMHSAGLLIKFASEGESDPDTLRSQLDAAMADY